VPQKLQNNGGFTGRGKTHFVRGFAALYQGTTLVVPQKPNTDSALTAAGM
jgi:hypothetical protein